MEQCLRAGMLFGTNCPLQHDFYQQFYAAINARINVQAALRPSMQNSSDPHSTIKSLRVKSDNIVILVLKTSAVGYFSFLSLEASLTKLLFCTKSASNGFRASVFRISIA